MHAEFWLERWRRGDIGWHDAEVNSHLRDYWPDLRLFERSRVLVPLCGKTLDLLWLASRGHQVLGVELSEEAVRDFFAENALRPKVTPIAHFQRFEVDELTILQGDFFALEPGQLGPVEAVFDRGSLVALPPEMRSAYAHHLTRLAGEAPCLLISYDYEQWRMAGPPFAVGREEIESLYGARYHIGELARFDLIEEGHPFRARGLEHLIEQVWRLDPLR